MTVATTGPNAPPTHELVVAVDQDYVFRYSVAVPSNGVTLPNALPVGDHVARLDVLAGCTVTTPNPVTVTLTTGATTDLGFTVACP